LEFRYRLRLPPCNGSTPRIFFSATSQRGFSSSCGSYIFALPLVSSPFFFFNVRLQVPAQWVCSFSPPFPSSGFAPPDGSHFFCFSVLDFFSSPSFFFFPSFQSRLAVVYLITFDYGGSLRLFFWSAPRTVSNPVSPLPLVHVRVSPPQSPVPLGTPQPPSRSLRIPIGPPLRFPLFIPCRPCVVMCWASPASSFFILLPRECPPPPYCDLFFPTHLYFSALFFHGTPIFIGICNFFASVCVVWSPSRPVALPPPRILKCCAKLGCPPPLPSSFPPLPPVFTSSVTAPLSVPRINCKVTPGRALFLPLSWAPRSFPPFVLIVLFFSATPLSAVPDFFLLLRARLDAALTLSVRCFRFHLFPSSFPLINVLL